MAALHAGFNSLIKWEKLINDTSGSDLSHLKEQISTSNKQYGQSLTGDAKNKNATPLS